MQMSHSDCLLTLALFLLPCHPLLASLCVCGVVVPPGHYHDAGQMIPCPPGTYRAEWRIPAAATLQDCLPCGDGISAQATEQVMLPTDLNNVNSAPVLTLVRASAASCCE